MGITSKVNTKEKIVKEFEKECRAYAARASCVVTFEGNVAMLRSHNNPSLDLHVEYNRPYYIAHIEACGPQGIAHRLQTAIGKACALYAMEKADECRAMFMGDEQ